MPKMIQIHVKPEKPKKQLVQNSLDVDDGDDLQYIINNVPKNAKFLLDIGYRGCVETKFVWFEEEPEEDFAEKLIEYNKELVKYEKWYEENREDIEFTLNEINSSQLSCWCVVDYNDGYIIVREGISIAGKVSTIENNDWIVGTKDFDTAKYLWEQFNEWQYTQCPYIDQKK